MGGMFLKPRQDSVAREKRWKGDDKGFPGETSGLSLLLAPWKGTGRFFNQKMP